MILFFVLFGFATGLPQSEREQTLQQYNRECRGTQFSTFCLKVDLLQLLKRLSESPPYQILPGVTVSSTILRPKSANNSNDTSTDGLLTEALRDYLKSLNLHMAVYNEDSLDYLYPRKKNLGEGRRKKMKNLSIYTVVAIAFALLSALAGKAVTLSIVSLVIAMIARNAAANSPPNNPSYDIVRRPQIQFANTHSQEDIYEAAHSGLPLSYVYPKQKSTTRAYPYKGYLQNESHESEDADSIIEYEL